MVDKSKFAEEDAMGYRITIFGRNVQVTEPMKNYAIEKISKIDRFHNHVMDVHVTMDIQRLEHSVVIILKFNHFKIKVQAVSSDMYASIDKAAHRLVTLLSRWKDKIQDHTKKGISAVDMRVNVLRRPYDEVAEINAEIEAENRKKIAAGAHPSIIGTDTIPLKILTAEEAIMKMELSGDDFMIFRGEEDQKIKVIYRREDGNYGVVLPE